MSLASSMAVIGDEVLQNWEVIGSGGFGQVFRARHKDWGFDVAVKMLHGNCSSSQALSEEANYMNKASSPFVLRVFGVYQGCPPVKARCERLGIVIEIMDRGSLQSLLQNFAGPPPWPLAFRLAHQLALGMNFLHQMTPPLLHQDLKPSNILLDNNLNAKLADFGLSSVSTSFLKCSTTPTGQVGGTWAFMPPEAFDLSYKPVRAYDIYSYGIVLWSILTGKEPYSGVNPSIVALRIPLGDRPSSKEVDHSKADRLPELVELMERCWEQSPEQRPPFAECLKVTESVFSRHKNGINHAVYEALSKLDSKTSGQASSTYLPSTFHIPPPARSKDTVETLTKEGDIPLKDPEEALATILSDRDKAKLVDMYRPQMIQQLSMAMAITEDLGEMVHPEIYSLIEAKETSEEKMRVLYSATLRSGGVKVKAAFYNAVRHHEPNLLERLGC